MDIITGTSIGIKLINGKIKPKKEVLKQVL